MRGRQLVRALKQRLDGTFSRIGELQRLNADVELQADFAKYLCVLVSGYLEVSVSELAIEHCRNRAQDTVSNFTGRQLSRWQNVKAEPLLQLVGSFNDDWRPDLATFMEGERKDALNSLIDLRRLRTAKL